MTQPEAPNATEPSNAVGELEFERIIKDSIRAHSGGHSLTNKVGDKLWHPHDPVNVTEISNSLRAALHPTTEAESVNGELLRAAQQMLAMNIEEYGNPDDHPDDDDTVGWKYNDDGGKSEPIPITFKMLREWSEAINRAQTNMQTKEGL